MNQWFATLATHVSRIMGHYWAFVIATLICLIWAASGPVFGFSDTWQLVINTGTTVLTFLMVFVIQNSQNRDSRSTQLKLDELIHAVKEASNRMIDIEEDTEENLDEMEEKFRRIGHPIESERLTT